MVRDLRTLLVLLFGIAVVCATAVSAADAPDDTADTADPVDRTAAWFDAHRDRPPALRAFLQRMPKGGDIHSHLGGAVYAETYLDWALDAGYCAKGSGDTLGVTRCNDDPGLTRLTDRYYDSGAYDRFIDQMSVRDLARSGRSGGDEFFTSFRSFGPVSRLKIGEGVAEVATRAANQRTYYLELMVSVQNGAVRSLAGGIDEGTDLAAMHRWLSAPGSGFDRLLAGGRQELDRLEDELQQAMDCDGPGAVPGCRVTIRYLQTSSRNVSPEVVFAQLAYAVELARTDPRVVGVNLVAPEDSRIALRDYTRHMQMLDFLVTRAPDVHVALHAGELTLGLVPPEDLRFHIREAVELGHARRIGHGVDMPYEDGALELLADMRDRGVLVEICLTSNDVILQVVGDDHPLSMYMEAGVPMTLATDDEGVSRIDLTHEYLRAALEHGLGYRDLKTMARNSLEHAFLPGESLFRPNTFEIVEACAHDSAGAADPSRACSDFLAASERAREQWRLEAELVEFERLEWVE